MQAPTQQTTQLRRGSSRPRKRQRLLVEKSDAWICPIDIQGVAMRPSMPVVTTAFPSLPSSLFRHQFGLFNDPVSDGRTQAKPRENQLLPKSPTGWWWWWCAPAPPDIKMSHHICMSPHDRSTPLAPGSWMPTLERSQVCLSKTRSRPAFQQQENCGQQTWNPASPIGGRRLLGKDFPASDAQTDGLQSSGGDRFI